MALNINGTTGISGVDGSVSAPALTGTDSNTGITFPSADTIKFSTGGVERMAITNSGVTGGGKFASYAIIEDQKGAGANGGTFTSGAWRTRDLNTEIADADNIVSISSNQFTLQAGNYLIQASAPAYNVDRHQAALYDITADNFHTIGTNEYAKGDAGTASRSIVNARVSISSANVYEIRHRCQTTFSTYGGGVFIGTSNWTTDNNYTYVIIFKES